MVPIDIKALRVLQLLALQEHGLLQLKYVKGLLILF